MNNIEFSDKLINIVGRPNYYNNKYPYNLGYYDGERISFDCWNLIKALIWDNDIDNNYTVGTFAHPNPATGLGDWDANGIISHCNYISNDFSKIPMGAFLYYEGGTHAGAYVGHGLCVESTIGWGKNGVIISEIGANGESTLNGEPRGKWTLWAKLPWIEYIEECQECQVDTEPERMELDPNPPSIPLEEPKSVWLKVLQEILEFISNLFKKA